MRSILRKTISNRASESKPGHRWHFYIPALLASLWLAGCAETETAVHVRDTAKTFRTVVIDAGHGGHDAGTRSSRYMLEKDAALDIALKLNQKLKAAGFNTVLTRSGDYFVTLDDRVSISDREQNAIFVSIHLNEAKPKPGIHGVETYYHSSQSAELAKRILSHVGSVPGESARGIHEARFHVLRLNTNPAVLVECGYFSNRAEALRFTKPDYRDSVATAISQAIVEQRR
jgi:N-acetylmuramoyl-L-alanine amidase